jgi:succinate-semialdehyde dehydrogenase/glutarate-semialdehyde dehydrogenase
MTLEPETLEPVQEDLQSGRNYIRGEWCEARGGRRHTVVDPATDEVFATVPDSGPDEAREAVDAASAAFATWRTCPARERAILLKRWHALILASTERLAQLISREMGKPLAESRGEVAYGASYVEWFAEEAVRTYGDVIPAPVQGRRMTVAKEPVGVVAAVTPWNFPLAMIARKIAPAVAAGCTVVAKPAEDAPLAALALAKLADEAGFPAGVVNVVTASRVRGVDLVAAWIADPRVRKITFTGSTPVGKHLARGSADTLKRLSLELGGNAPFIVFDDADVNAAVEGLMKAKFRNGGQTCVSPNRVYVQDAVYDAFAAKITQRVAALRVGPATIATSQIGPKIDRHVTDALARGATLLTGGRRLRDTVADGPNYYTPTVLGDASSTLAMFNEETFGPVVPLCRFGSEAEVLRAANATPFGLAAYFYSRDAVRINRVAEGLEAGIVGINEGALASEAAPFGGIKESGYGREGSRYGLDDYLQTKYMCQGGLS